MIINVEITDLFDKQREIANKIVNTPASQTKYHILRASRQSGKTYLIERLAIYFALSGSNLRIAFTNAQHAQNKKVWDEMEQVIDPQILKSKSNNDGARHFTFINDSEIKFYTAKNYNSVVGSTFDYFIGDEFALWPTMAWDYIQPTVAAKQKAKVVLASTPRGKNAFHKLSQEAQQNDPFKMEHCMLYLDNPHYDLREIEDAKKNKTEFVWRQEYLAQFILGRGQVFGDFTKVQTVRQWPEYKKNKRYFYAIDFAGSGSDATVLIIMDEDGEVVYVYEATGENSVRVAAELFREINKWGTPEDVVGYGERNGLGEVMVDILQDKGLNIHDYHTSNESKNTAVGLLLKDIGNEHVRLPDADLCPKLDNEMSTYEVSRLPSGKLAYSHPKGLHDDYVDSLIIANKARHDFTTQSSTTYDPDEYSPDIKDYQHFKELVSSNNSEDLYDDYY